jgi:hypothetical protein
MLSEKDFSYVHNTLLLHKIFLKKHGTLARVKQIWKSPMCQDSFRLNENGKFKFFHQVYSYIPAPAQVPVVENSVPSPSTLRLIW